MSITEAIAELVAACKTVDGLQVSTERGQNLELPAVMIEPPQMSFEAFSPAPTGAIFHVFVIVPSDEYATERLWTFTPQVAQALEANTDGTVQSPINPGLYQLGSSDFPAYEIICEVPL